MNMDLGASKTHVEIIKEGEFGVAYFSNTILVLIENDIKNQGKDLMI